MLQVNDNSMNNFRKPSGFGHKFGGQAADHSHEPHKTTCDGCQAMCEVPFRPNGKKPVYCRNCYKGKATTTSFTGQPFSRTTESHTGIADTADLKKQFSILNTKLDRLIAVIEEHTRAVSRGQ